MKCGNTIISLKRWVDTSVEIHRINKQILDVDDEIFLCKKCYRTFESMVDTFLETEEVRS